MVSFEKAEKNLDEIMKSPFKEETAEEHRAFVASTEALIKKMNSYVSAPEEQLKKQMTL